MEKGYSIVTTATDSGNSRYLFLSKRLLNLILIMVAVIVIIVAVAAFNYLRVYYRALEVEMLRRRNTELEQEFAKIEEIKRNLEIAEMNSQKIKVMLGIEKTPTPVQLTLNEVKPNYSEQVNTYFEKEENIPSLLPATGQISRNFTVGHEGIDIAAPRFSPIIATASGAVSDVGWDSLYGNYVVITHDENYSTFYGHLNSFNAKKDDRVSGGSIIGTVGSSGKSTSPHLHYEIRFRGRPVDPTGYIPYFVKL